MTPQDPAATTSRNDGAIIARIQAQDVSYVEPLREFLKQYGCRVVVNAVPDARPDYTICAGDGDFVKSFFAGNTRRGNKQFAIVYDAPFDGLDMLAAGGTKVYMTDPQPLSDHDTRQMFSFFFTGTHPIINTRKEPVRQITPGGKAKEPSREEHKDAQAQLQQDARRINQTMRQVFASSAGPAKKRRKIQKKLLLRIAAIIVSVVIVPLVLYVGVLATGIGLLAASSKLLLTGNLTWAQTLHRASVLYIESASAVLRISSPLYSLTRTTKYASDQERLLSVITDASLAEAGVMTIFRSSKQIAGSILFPQSSQQRATVADVVSLTSEVARVSQHLALVQAELDSLLSSSRFPFNTSGVQTLGSRGVAMLHTIRTMVGYTEQVLMLYPEMGGFRTRQTYLVLLQNSMELRPTGGFIGSLMQISFADGLVDEMKVVDVYTADGQLKGHVDPPQPIRDIIGQEHWYLRDSNWDPDFAVSGAQAAWFYEKEMGIKPDGVIAVSLPVLTRLLRVVGPLELSDFNDRITESNFYAKSLLYTQTDFFPGSTQKKDFLGALTNAMLMRMTADTSISAGQLLRVLTDSLNARDIQFYFSDAKLEQLVSQWGWAGQLLIDPCMPVYSEPVCFGDGVSLIEANVGINKVNYFVTRESLSDVTLDPDGGVVRQVLTSKIKNNSPLKEGGGAYQTYLRAYYPLDTSVRSVRLDGVEIPPLDTSEATPSAQPYIISRIISDALVLEIPFSVSPGEERQLVAETDRPFPQFHGAGSYQFSLRKQSGVTSHPWHVVIHYPAAWGVVAPAAVAKPGRLEYNTDLSEDLHIQTLFERP